MCLFDQSLPLMDLHFMIKKEVLKANLTNLLRCSWSPKLTLKLVPESLLGSLLVVQWVVPLVVFLDLLRLSEGVVH